MKPHKLTAFGYILTDYQNFRKCEKQRKSEQNDENVIINDENVKIWANLTFYKVTKTSHNKHKK
nr:MAG TPA: hypothetical protein [Bacteriophage sp.]